MAALLGADYILRASCAFKRKRKYLGAHNGKAGKIKKRNVENNGDGQGMLNHVIILYYLSLKIIFIKSAVKRKLLVMN